MSIIVTPEAFEGV